MDNSLEIGKNDSDDFSNLKKLALVKGRYWLTTTSFLLSERESGTL